ncbi:hypothetical protein N8077_05955, partial [Myxococcota bacterium]|nr:hypothetical protein [Myxococcota bacterium]
MEPNVLDGAAGTIAGALFVGLLMYLVIEVVVLHFRLHRLRLREARTASIGLFSTIGINVLIARLGAPFSVAVAASLASAITPIDSFGTSAPAWIYGWLVYEFWYWV